MNGAGRFNISGRFPLFVGFVAVLWQAISVFFFRGPPGGLPLPRPPALFLAIACGFRSVLGSVFLWAAPLDNTVPVRTVVFASGSPCTRPAAQARPGCLGDGTFIRSPALPLPLGGIGGSPGDIYNCPATVKSRKCNIDRTSGSSGRISCSQRLKNGPEKWLRALFFVRPYSPNRAPPPPTSPIDFACNRFYSCRAITLWGNPADITALADWMRAKRRLI